MLENIHFLFVFRLSVNLNVRVLFVGDEIFITISSLSILEMFAMLRKKSFVSRMT
jgi:hypothetical protein